MIVSNPSYNLPEPEKICSYLFEKKCPEKKNEELYQEKKNQDKKMLLDPPLRKFRPHRDEPGWPEIKRQQDVELGRKISSLNDIATIHIADSAEVENNDTSWESFGAFRDDPTWIELFDEIEYRRNFGILQDKKPAKKTDKAGLSATESREESLETSMVTLSGPLRYNTPWELFGRYKDDPAWTEAIDEIERQQDVTEN